MTNLLLHIAATLLLFLALLRATGSLWRSGAAAALFAIHPLHVESVAWVAERKDTLSTFFWMLTILAYVYYTERPKIGRYVLAAVPFALGLTAKPMLVTLPIVLLLLDYWPLARFRPSVGSKTGRITTGRRLVLEKMPLLALACASSVITFLVQRQAGAVAPIEMIPFGVRAANAAVAYAAYILKMVWPWNLSVFYPHPVDTLPVWQVLLSGLLFISITALAIRAARSRRYVAVGWFWYVITLLPVIGLVQIGSHAMADRFTYVPLIGLFIIVAWGVPDLFARFAERSSARRIERALPALASIVLLALGLRTYSQVGYWRNDITLFSHALDVTANNALAHNNLGLALAARGKMDEALKHLSEAVRIKPDNADAHNNLAILLARQGRIDEAMEHYSETLRLDPNRPDAHNKLGIMLAAKGRLDEAMRHFSEALRIDPGNADALTYLGKGCAAQGRVTEAIRHYREALRLNPKAKEAANDLAWILATDKNPKFRDGAEAVRLAAQACGATGFRDPVTLDTLAAAYAEAGRFQEAKATARRALALAQSTGRPGFVEQVRARLRLYEAHRPFHAGQDSDAAPSGHE